MSRPNDMEGVKKHGFESLSSKYLKTRLAKIEDEEGPIGIDLKPMFVGIAGVRHENGDLKVAISMHDSTYSVDFSERHFSTNDPDHLPSALCTSVTNFVIAELNMYQHEHRCKFLGAGLERAIAEDLCPELCPALWAKLDIVPIVFSTGVNVLVRNNDVRKGAMCADEEADAVARKCVMFFGPNQQPQVEIGFRNKVEVDAGGRIQLATLQGYRDSVGTSTWEATLKYAIRLAEKRTKIAFLSSTPQGGGVALMRHALVRFLRLLGVDVSWYVPKPSPEVFRITKHNHNILQGVANPGVRMSESQAKTFTDWINRNAERYWLTPDGPLASRKQGGADVVFIDDPQMPGLIPLAKKADPDRLVLFRSHIQIRSDLAAQQGSPTAEVWDYLWSRISAADIFISHPVRDFVPASIPRSMVGFMPATTDWLDGLNKDLDSWNTRYYIHNFKLDCDRVKVPQLDYPRRDYIIQVARFDPAKGIPDAIKSYAKLRRDLYRAADVPQLLITGVSAIDDPDGTLIYDQTMELLESYPDIASDVCVMRVGPTDQLLNALMSQAKIALQLSTREGFEVKVSEAVHKGIPIIATQAGGIPLQVQHDKNGFLVEPGDYDAVASHMHTLITDNALYDRMSSYARESVSDEVSTVGNALSWLYLADAMSEGRKLVPNGRWINDMARDAAGFAYEEGEVRLPREVKA